LFGSTYQNEGVELDKKKSKPKSLIIGVCDKWELIDAEVYDEGSEDDENDEEDGNINENSDEIGRAHV
jgi:hypothetical protein